MSEVTSQYSCSISRVAVQSSYLGSGINPIMMGKSQLLLLFSPYAYQMIL